MVYKDYNIHYLAIDRKYTQNPCLKICLDSERAFHLESRHSFSDKVNLVSIQVQGSI